MNICKQELKVHFKQFLGWSIAIALMLVLSMVKYEALGTTTSNNMLNELMEKFPTSLQYIMGMNPDLNLSNYLDYFILVLNYTIILGAVFASIIGSNLVAKEELDKSADFLYSKPVTRTHILLSKFVAGIILNFALILLLWIASIAINYAMYPKEIFFLDIAKLMLAHLFIQILFYCIGFGSNFLTTSKKASSIAGIIVLYAYIVSKISEIFHITTLEYFTPFKYFDFVSIIHGNGFQLLFLTLAILVCITFVLATIQKYKQKDLQL